MAVIGYARVSTNDQDVQLQIDALEAAGADRVFTDHGVSGAKTSRPQLDAALEYLREGDVLTVWKLDRLGRSLPHLIDTVQGLADRGVGFRSITEGFDTTSAGGRMIFHVFGALAEFERELIRERTHAGLVAAAANGRKGGRRPTFAPEDVAKARKYRDQGMSAPEVAKLTGMSRATVYRLLAEDSDTDSQDIR
jgi:DNA invertase Pin-like site-specific DNA recombinase